MNYNKPISVEEISSKLKPILGRRIDELYFRYSVSESQEERIQIIQILSALYQKYLGQFLDKKVLLEPPKQTDVSGEYELSKVIYAEKELFPFALREEDWPRHVCISGMSGSGKTTFAFNILKEFIKKDKPFLVFDWKKSFRPLINYDPNVMCFTIGNNSISNLFKTNINVPPKGVSPKEWINTLCDLITESFCVSFGVHKILLETLDEVFEGWGVYKDSTHYPNWQHIKKMLEIKSKEARGREAAWYESALRIATVLTFGDFGKVINYEGKKSISIEEIFDKKIIFELNSLSNIEKKFFSEYVLSYIFKLKKSNSEKTTNEFNHAILVDEAHNIFLKEKTHFVSESITDVIYREMREYGTCLICLDQHLSKLSDTVKGNSACHIAFQQQLPQDIYDISSIMQLSEKRDIFTHLPVGYAIVKLSERHTRPFLIKAPYIDLKNSSISDSKISTKMDYIARVAEVEKDDLEFKKALIEVATPSTINPISQVSNLQSKSITPKLDENPSLNNQSRKASKLTSTQEVLYEFIQKQVKVNGLSIKEAERTLEKGLSEGLYKELDILLATNYFFEKEISNKYYLDLGPKEDNSHNIDDAFNQKNILNNEIVDKVQYSVDEQALLSLLYKNPNHYLSTVELYESAGVSSRKGNIAKNNLLLKGKIKIHEERSNKGWRKIIRLI